MARPRIQLATRREGPARGGHPWVFSGAVAAIDREPAPGDEVDVVDARGGFIARGLFNPASQIRVRLYAWDDVALDRDFFRARIRQAVSLRRDARGWNEDGACRLVFSEGDFLSGLTVDRYLRHLTVQLTSRALADRREWIFDALEELLEPEGIVLRTEKGVLEEEGLRLEDGPVRGRLPEGELEIHEGVLRFGVDVAIGQKTGFYLDQRINRAAAAAYASGRSVADVCCYSGGFGITALAAGAAAVRAVDVSAGALELAEANARRNGVSDRFSSTRADAFRWLGQERDAGRRYGMVVLDPPRFARTKRGVPEALKAYRRLNALALSVLEPGGVLVTCSCSGRVSREAFQDAVARAAIDAGRDLRILERLGQPPDHPVAASCPESEYLKCLVCHAA